MKHIRMILTLICLLLFCACSLLPDSCIGNLGRGDWEINLVNGYRIDHFNASEIKLCKKQNKYFEVVIKNYYVTAYSMKEEYVFLEGIQTAGEYITDQEKEARILSYYALDTTDDSVIGPFDTADELSKALDLSGIDWMPITNPPDLPNVRY